MRPVGFPDLRFLLFYPSHVVIMSTQFALCDTIRNIFIIQLEGGNVRFLTWKKQRKPEAVHGEIKQLMEWKASAVTDEWCAIRQGIQDIIFERGSKLSSQACALPLQECSLEAMSQLVCARNPAQRRLNVVIEFDCLACTCIRAYSKWKTEKRWRCCRTGTAPSAASSEESRSSSEGCLAPLKMTTRWQRSCFREESKCFCKLIPTSTK